MAEQILIIRLSAIGDIVMASCLAQGIRQQHPDAKISWLAQSGYEGLLQENPYVDEVIVWPRKAWQSLWRERKFIVLFREVRQFVKELRQRGFTLAIDAQGLMKSGLFTILSGAKTRIGLDSREGSAALMTRVYHSPQSSDMGSEYRFLLEKIGPETYGARMGVAVSGDDRSASSTLLQQQGIVRPFVVFCPFSTREQKNWTTEHWQQLAEAVDERLVCDCVILGSPADTDTARTMTTPENLFDLTGKTTLRQAAALIGQAKALVGVDTGLTHIGVVSEVPTVALFGSTCPYLRTESPVARVIYHDLPCAPCRRRPVCDGAFTCMHEISASEVMTQLQRVLKL
ncbi:MAG: glycosyltransferase family 9 protein [Pseudomonadota bacterium]